MSDNSQWAPIADIAQQVQTGKVKARTLVDQSLKTIADKKE